MWFLTAYSLRPMVRPSPKVFRGLTSSTKMMIIKITSTAYMHLTLVRTAGDFDLFCHLSCRSNDKLFKICHNLYLRRKTKTPLKRSKWMPNSVFTSRVDKAAISGDDSSVRLFWIVASLKWSPRYRRKGPALFLLVEWRVLLALSHCLDWIYNSSLSDSFMVNRLLHCQNISSARLFWFVFWSQKNEQAHERCFRTYPKAFGVFGALRKKYSRDFLFTFSSSGGVPPTHHSPNYSWYFRVILTILRAQTCMVWEKSCIFILFVAEIRLVK